MLNLVQHLMKSMDDETLKRVQGDMLGVLGRPETSCRWNIQGKGPKIREASLLSRVLLSYPEHPSKGECGEYW